MQAIWAALVHEFKILDINPPPAYAKRTQRLRTPSEVVASNSVYLRGPRAAARAGVSNTSMSTR